MDVQSILSKLLKKIKTLFDRVKQNIKTNENFQPDNFDLIRQFVVSQF